MGCATQLARANLYEREEKLFMDGMRTIARGGIASAVRNLRRRGEAVVGRGWLGMGGELGVLKGVSKHENAYPTSKS